MSAEALVSPPSASDGLGNRLWRFAALGLFIGGPALLLAIGSANLSGASQALDAAEQNETSIRAIVRQLAQRRERPQDAVDTSALYLVSSNGSLAQAELQTLAAHLVEAAAGHLIASQSPDAAETDQNGIVDIQLTLDIGNDGLLNLLYALETGLPILNVSALSARAASGSDKPEDNGRLHVEMTVQGFWKKPAP